MGSSALSVANQATERKSEKQQRDSGFWQFVENPPTPGMWAWIQPGLFRGGWA